jgi:hypothetical protein
VDAVLTAHARQTRVEVNGPLVFPFSAGPVPLVPFFDVGQRDVSIGKLLVERQRFHGRLLRFRHGLFRGHQVDARSLKLPVGVGQSGIGLRVARVFGNGLLEIREGFLHILLLPIQVIPAFRYN